MAWLRFFLWVGRVFLGSMLEGWVLSVLWLWFVVSNVQFHATPLTSGQAWGMALILALAVRRHPRPGEVIREHEQLKEDKANYYSTAIVVGMMETFASPLLVLGIAWAVRRAVFHMG